MTWKTPLRALLCVVSAVSFVGCSGDDDKQTGTDPANASDASVNGDDGIDPNDPPKASPACGDDLDVHNGTVIPGFPKTDGGEFNADPIEAGPYQVKLEDVSLDNPDPSRNKVSATAYGPTSDGETLIEGKLPLVVILPGFSGNHTGYRHFTDHFVSHGFAVLGVTAANVAFTDAPNNPANVKEIEAAIDWATDRSQLKGHVDETRMAIAGHSQGGKLAFFTAVTDSRFKIVLGWDPQNGGGAPCFIAGAVGQDCDAWPVAPVCDRDRNKEDSGMMQNLRAESITFAARDTNITPDSHLWAEHFYRGAPSPAHLVLFTKATHGDWGAAGATTDVTRRVQMAFLLTRFMGKRGLEEYLPGKAYAKSVENVEVYDK